MGNHDVGRGMNAAAKGFWAGRNGQPEPTKEEALKFLDAVGEEWRGADAEFDDYRQPDEPLGRLLVIAFGPWTGEGLDEDKYWDDYYNKIEEPFSQRYDFC